MTKSRVALLIAVVLLFNTALDLGASYLLAKTPAGQALLRDFLVNQSQKSFAVLSPALGTSTPSIPPGVLPVPESYATRDYFDAINNVLQDIFAINATNARLGPLLDILNRQTLSCSYVGFYEAMGQAHQLANKNQTLVSQLTFHLSALASANIQTKDAITKADTLALIATGATFTASLQEYASASNGLLIGDTPTSAQISEFQSKVNSATGASQSFANALKPLLQRIIEGSQAVINSSSTTTR